MSVCVNTITIIIIGGVVIMREREGVRVNVGTHDRKIHELHKVFTQAVLSAMYEIPFK